VESWGSEGGRNFKVILSFGASLLSAELVITEPLIDLGLEAVTNRLRCYVDVKSQARECS
jgi:hypothetical protein